MTLDAHTELFRHDGIAVTRSWIIVNGAQHAIRYVDQTSLLPSEEPPRGTALGVLAICLLLAMITIFRIATGGFSLGLGWFILIACASVILIAGHIAFVQKGRYQLSIRFENGESIAVTTDNASRANALQSAIHDALDKLDYHDTDDARPTVVLASLEPTKLSAVGGPKPDIIRINDDKELTRRS